MQKINFSFIIDGFVKSHFRPETVILSVVERCNKASGYEILFRYIGTQNDKIRLFTSSS